MFQKQDLGLIGRKADHYAEDTFRNTDFTCACQYACASADHSECGTTLGNRHVQIFHVRCISPRRPLINSYCFIQHPYRIIDRRLDFRSTLPHTFIPTTSAYQHEILQQHHLLLLHRTPSPTLTTRIKPQHPPRPNLLPLILQPKHQPLKPRLPPLLPDNQQIPHHD